MTSGTDPALESELVHALRVGRAPGGPVALFKTFNAEAVFFSLLISVPDPYLPCKKHADKRSPSRRSASNKQTVSIATGWYPARFLRLDGLSKLVSCIDSSVPKPMIRTTGARKTPCGQEPS